MTFYAYLLLCNDGSYYAGHTDNLDARLYAHQAGVFRGYTFKRRPVQLVWYELFSTRDEAFQAERQIKGWNRQKKQALIRGDWDTIRALARLRSTDRVTVNRAGLPMKAARPSSTSG